MKKNHSKEEFEKIGIHITPVVTKFYDKAGKEIDNERKSLIKAVGNKYFVRYYRGCLFNPYGIDASKCESPDVVFKEVKQNVYEAYHKFLNTKIEAHYLLASKLFNNRG